MNCFYCGRTCPEVPNAVTHQIRRGWIFDVQTWQEKWSLSLFDGPEHWKTRSACMQCSKELRAMGYAELFLRTHRRANCHPDAIRQLLVVYLNDNWWR